LDKDRKEARRCYRGFVRDGIGQGIWEGLRQQIYFGDEAFVEKMQSRADVKGDTLAIPRAQRRPPPPSLAEIAAHHGERNATIAVAYTTGPYSYRQIAVSPTARETA
jgi:putative transposase